MSYPEEISFKLIQETQEGFVISHDPFCEVYLDEKIRKHYPTAQISTYRGRPTFSGFSPNSFLPESLVYVGSIYQEPRVAMMKIFFEGDKPLFEQFQNLITSQKMETQENGEIRESLPIPISSRLCLFKI